MKYNRNWQWETKCHVYFEDGTIWNNCHCQTDNKGKLNWFSFGESKYNIDDTKSLKRMGVRTIFFSTPAKLTL